MRASNYNPRQRNVQKALVRRDDERAMRSGLKSAGQIKRESGSFAFGPDRASINLSSARKLI